MTPVQRPQPPNVLRQYLHRLTNLAAGNRMLFMPRLTARQYLDLHELSQLKKETSFKIIESLIAEKAKAICPLADAHLPAATVASQKLKHLQRLGQFLFDEHGSHDLHVGWPFVRGKFADGTRVRCPLLLFPVSLTLRNHEWVLEPRADQKVGFNKTFLLAYAHYHRVTLSEELLEEDFDEVDRDSTVFRTAIYQALQKARIEVHFNTDNFRDELTAFRAYTRDEFDAETMEGGLKLFPEAALGVFPRAGSYLIPDYVQLLEQGNTSVERIFEQHAPSGEERKVRDEDVHTVFAMDAWQEHALHQVKTGRSIVVQGPPGTGKSQLIANLATDAMANRKRVLIVCQKRAALDVVYERLKSQRLHAYAGLVHDFIDDRTELFGQLAHQIERVDEYKTLNNQSDAILLERNFYQACRQMAHLTEELTELKNALFDERECGTSIKSLYLTSSPDEPHINVKQQYEHWPTDRQTAFAKILSRYCFFAARLEHDGHPWRERLSFAHYQPSQRRQLQEAMEQLPLQFVRVYEPVRQLIGINLSWADCENLMQRRAAIVEMLALIDSPARFTYFQQMLNEHAEETSALWLSNIERVVNDCYRDPGPETSVAGAHLGQFQLALTRSMKARKSLWGLVRWELFSKDKILITRTLVSNGLQNNPVGFSTLESKLDNRLNLEHNLSKLKEKKWLVDLPLTYDLLAFQHWAQDQQRAIQAKNLFHTLRELGHTLGTPPNSLEEWRHYFETLLAFIDQTHALKKTWAQFFTPTQIERALSTPDYGRLASEQLQTDFDALVEYDKLKRSLSSDEQELIDRLAEKEPSWQAEVIEKLFLNSLRLAWIDHIETKHPVLTLVSSGKLALMEQELRQHIAQKQQGSTDIVHLRVREAITDNLEYNRLNNRVTYRELLHQVTKKRKRWPLRKVFQEFEDEVFRLVPCWLASPESVSAIFPLKPLFDIVIFDEASQCFAEHGLPAMCRGRQVVVAGDKQQLKPGDLYRIRWQDDADEHADLETESLLDLCSRYLPQTGLRWHYRSESIPLIHFSNTHFYEGKLTLLPHRQTFHSPEKPIEYFQVAGMWAHQQNEAEAKAITRWVIDYLDTKPHLSLGVVTFNAPQQELIMDYLDAAFAAAGRSWPEQLFVKNIENVQGDERDIILFSVGYGPDDQGKIKAQFGSLNVAGGENRLNVAITRARKKIIVVASLLPDQLPVEGTINPGPKLLRDYLRYAHALSLGTDAPPPASVPHSSAKLRDRIMAWSSADEYYDDRFLPHLDLTVVKNKRPHTILLTDDDDYQQSLSPKERHAILPTLLEANHWKYHVCYSRNYWNNRERLQREIRKLGND
ncbi:MAG: AAA domain-containing protein [Cyclobacteriaceae bacterium]|jgi:hypothetical protein|nr:AAA domain-containing protein [Cyclobacteriaceae bacterium]